MKHILFAATCMFATLCAAPADAAGRPCGERSFIIDRLRDSYGEERVSAGLAANNGIVEVFVSAANGTWTILVTMPSGESCLVAAGEGWENIPLPSSVPGAPA